MEDYQETMNIIEEHEKIIKTNKNNIIHFAQQQGKVFRRFKENRKFKKSF